MGEIADDLIDRMWDEYYDDDSTSTIRYYLSLHEKELRELCKKPKSKKIISIRNYHQPLSERQRYCLAVWAYKYTLD